jgi:ubiquitin C-terminal hydrolase
MTFRQSLLNSTGSRGARLLSLCLLIGSPRGFTAFAADVKSSTFLNPSLVSTGLNNLGNTCYMNAQLQCAFHIPGIRQIAIMEEEEKVAQADPADSDCEEVDEEDSTTASILSSDPPSDALLALRELFQDMVKAADQQFPAAVQPRSFCVRLGIPVMVQQDSQEFWKLLLPAVNKEALSDLYKGSFEDYITALDGSGRERRREELFLDLSLDISSR